jgi:7-cyano-7-deazaguanine synthase in queuosine biosynthesis
MPVLDFDKWQSNKDHIEQMVSFLSGDVWEFEFRPREYNEQEIQAEQGFRRRKKKILTDKFCMLSGGLDSFIGAIDLLDESQDIIFIGHYGGGKGVKPYQDQINEKLIKHYKLNDKQFFNFHASPIGGIEDTTRTRSLLFFAHAIILASTFDENTTIFVPENGFISLNIPLTNTRLGSSSTRTTHPFYMQSFQTLLKNLGLKITFNNPYQFLTKGEMIQNCKDFGFLKKNIGFTMSCSHPDIGRYKKESQPSHCGNCLPCVIRRSAILKAYSNDLSSYRDKEFELSITSINNLRSYKISLLGFKNSNLDNSLIIQNAGPISSNIKEYYGVYKRGMMELDNLLKTYE